MAFDSEVRSLVAVLKPDNAADNVGVTKVECYLDGALASSMATLPASFSWTS